MGHLTQALLHGHAGGRVHDLGRHGQRARRLLNLVRQHAAALAPAASGSKLTITFAVCRLRIATCCSVKAVPLVAITF